MTDVRALLEQGTRALSGAGARREAAVLLRSTLGVSDAWLIAHDRDAVGAESTAAYLAAIRRRAAGEPVAYLTGVRGFHALELRVTPDVLIPRTETELLVDCVLRRLPAGSPCRVADLGTGSGAVALAIAHARPQARVVATDASPAALRVARGNATRLGLGNVEWLHGDWCAALGDLHFDVIASNPPYVAIGDGHLRAGDVRFEPAMALVSGPDGLDAIRCIVRDAAAHLAGQGWLLFEHGFEQGAAARELLRQRGYKAIFTARDVEGRERVSGGQVAAA
ncbi:MAG: peptide chain release factor N(5)-glutamine methyltransferase [Rhodanobacteraceae bacterium]|nr:MAG: peptide chain release factor N(5)-glutamine methyltransferase [Rhodanobacteraceae bacterium]